MTFIVVSDGRENPIEQYEDEVAELSSGCSVQGIGDGIKRYQYFYPNEGSPMLFNHVLSQSAEYFNVFVQNLK